MKLSIIIAAYNVEKHIEKCVMSCVRQNISTSDYEIVVINDGSIDRTQVVLNKLVNGNDNLRVVHQKNSGLGGARNTGILHSRGNYIWFIDGDDLIEKNCLADILQKISNERLDALGVNYAITNEAGQLIRVAHDHDFLKEEVTTGGKYYNAHYYYSYSWQYLFRKELFSQKPQIKFLERVNMQDSEILPRIMERVMKIGFMDKVCYYYVQHSQSYTNSAQGETRFNYFQSIITVRDSLKIYDNTTSNKLIKEGIGNKLATFDQIVFHHLVFFKYERTWLLRILRLLSENDFYPLKHQTTGKMTIVKWGLNHFPVGTKLLIDSIRRDK